MTYDPNNIFAKILRGEIPCQKVYEDDHVLAFNDIAPQAPVHILVIPKGAYKTVEDFGLNAGAGEIKAFYMAVAKIVEEQALNLDGFRTISNSGINGGQEVPHYHLHILGGKKLGPMLAKAA
ncbi:MAG: histidine triad nucleotide-binding protein [Alphaproteobacteria bacterium]|nr:histidine triad nucleotide-binding protein [Alphaproteobacteria bacterium]MCD8571386.1 histidine triad nucleotide-binding protein [Alphaproteobacteria bacterium]